MDAAAFRRLLQKKMEENRKAFEGLYKEQLNELLGLSKEQIDTITPDGTDLVTYDRLITVVREASRINIAQAQLRQHIEGLGNVAVEIAKRVPSLAVLFA